MRKKGQTVVCPLSRRLENALKNGAERHGWFWGMRFCCRTDRKNIRLRRFFERFAHARAAPSPNCSKMQIAQNQSGGIFLFSSSSKSMVLYTFPHGLHRQSQLLFFAFLCINSSSLPQMGQLVFSSFHKRFKNARISFRVDLFKSFNTAFSV